MLPKIVEYGITVYITVSLLILLTIAVGFNQRPSKVTIGVLYFGVIPVTVLFHFLVKLFKNRFLLALRIKGKKSPPGVIFSARRKESAPEVIFIERL